MIRKTINASLSIAIISLSIALPAQATVIFSDVDNSHPNFRAINHLYLLCPDKFKDVSYFYPDKSISRGDFLDILFCQSLIGEEVMDYEIPFSDVTGDEYFAESLKLGLILEVIQGFEDNTFRDWADITVMETIKTLMKLEAINNKMVYGDYINTRNKYANWGEEYIEYSKKLNLLDNIENKINDKLKRKELAEIIYRYDAIISSSAQKYDTALDKDLEYLTVFVKKSQKNNIRNLFGAISLLNQYYLYPEELNEIAPYKNAIRGLFDGIEDPYTVAYEQEEFITSPVFFDQVDLGFTFKEKEINGWYYYVVDAIQKDSLAYDYGLRKNNVINNMYIGDFYKGDKDDFFLLFTEGDENSLENEYLSEYNYYLAIDFSISHNSSSSKYIEIPLKLDDEKGARIEVLNNNVLYLRIRTFDHKALLDFKNELKRVTLNRDEVKAYILDLRNNPGGEIDILMKITEHIFEKDTLIFQAIDSTGESKEIRTINFNNSSPLRNEDVPWVILTDSYTASASEILAYAIDDLKKDVTIMGTDSYGKGRMQMVFSFLSEELALAITNGEMMSPLGNIIDQEGIKADILLDSGELFTNYNLLDDKAIRRALDML